MPRANPASCFRTQRFAERKEGAYLWVMPAKPPDLVFYDGSCGLCHHAVKYCVRRDRDGSRFLYAPLFGPTFNERVPAERQEALPDSLVVLTPEGELLVESDATAHLLGRIGGFDRFLGATLRIIPRFIRDGGYRFIARIRRKIFKTPEESCPLLPPELRARFLP